ncbi:MAG: hypothetical protein ACOVNN_08375, partial [Limnohabitans sp.]
MRWATVASFANATRASKSVALAAQNQRLRTTRGASCLLPFVALAPNLESLQKVVQAAHEKPNRR